LYGTEWPSFGSTLEDCRTRISTSANFQTPSLQQLSEFRVTLDYIPTHLLSAIIREFQSNLDPQYTCTIEFSAQLTVGEAGITSGCFTHSNPSLLQALFCVSRTPKMYRSAHERSSRKWSVAPLYTTLAFIIDLLTSGPHALEVMVVHNVSHEYCRHLLSHDGTHPMNRIARWQTFLFRDRDHMGGLGVLARYIAVVRKR
jgi:hypothetical protein